MLIINDNQLIQVFCGPLFILILKNHDDGGDDGDDDDDDNDHF